MLPVFRASHPHPPPTPTHQQPSQQPAITRSFRRPKYFTQPIHSLTGPRAAEITISLDRANTRPSISSTKQRKSHIQNGRQVSTQDPAYFDTFAFVLTIMADFANIASKLHSQRLTVPHYTSCALEYAFWKRGKTWRGGDKADPRVTTQSSSPSSTTANSTSLTDHNWLHYT